jgi:AcrR family transcriptional regulator
MARQREFDEATALEAAMACFWRRGYEATSMHELTASIGISGPSLYSAFGGKRAFFTAALERHFDQSPRGAHQAAGGTAAPERRGDHSALAERSRAARLPADQLGAGNRPA